MIRYQRFAAMAEAAPALAAAVAGRLAAAITRRGRARLAVPGGSTPAAFLEALAAQPIAWPRVAGCLTDERLVPAGHPASNEAMVARTLRQGPGAGIAWQRLDDPGFDAATPFDVIVLGMGGDGHVASIFPGMPGLLAGPPAVLAARPPGREPRLTLNGPVLQQAASLHLLIAGAEKAAVLDAALAGGDVAACPARLLAAREGETMCWMVA
ncbi:MAG: 6-phosphogluconolactonase [Thalassobaculales bacterium]